MCNDLKLEVNPKRTKITPFKNGSFEYLKKRIMITKSGKVVMRLTRKNITKRRKRMQKQKALLDAGEISYHSIKQSYQAWRAYADRYNSHETIKGMDSIFKELFKEEIMEAEYVKELNRLQNSFTEQTQKISAYYDKQHEADQQAIDDLTIALLEKESEAK